MSRVEIIGDATLYLGDCWDVLPGMQRPDAIASDPPYGQSLKTNNAGKGVKGRSPGAGRPYGTINPAGIATVWPSLIQGDNRPFDPAPLLTLADKVLLWGGHKFGHRLPRGRWLAWDKVPTGKIRDQGDGELAWTNVNPEAPLRIYRLLWDGVCVGSAARHEVTAGAKRAHPMQKPECLMAWCLGFLDLAAESLICDPFMGAGSTGLAAIAAGHRFVGCEIETLFFDTACRRIEAAQRQGQLFGAVA